MRVMRLGVFAMLLGTTLMPESDQAVAGWSLTGPEKAYQGEADYATMCKLFPRMVGGGKWLGQPLNRHKFRVNWNGWITPRQIDSDDWQQGRPHVVLRVPGLRLLQGNLCWSGSHLVSVGARLRGHGWARN